MNNDDLKSIGIGVIAWSLAVPAVKYAGDAVVKGGQVTKVVALAFGGGLAASTTPLLSYIMGWKTPHSRVRGIALALGAAQTIDGLVYLFLPDFYSNDPQASVACAGNIFYGAGLLGILSAYM
jgi:hypothetical protein